MQIDLEIFKPDFDGLDFAIGTFAQILAFVSTFWMFCFSLLIRMIQTVEQIKQINSLLDGGLHVLQTKVRNYFIGFVLASINDLELCRNSRKNSSFSRKRSCRSKRAWEYMPFKLSRESKVDWSDSSEAVATDLEWFYCYKHVILLYDFYCQDVFLS